MTIFQIPSYPELQNAPRHSRGSEAAPVRPVSPAASTDSAITGNTGATLGQSLGITAMINSLQQHVESNLNIVRDPPFFPIATYQRVDLIRRIRIVEEEVQRSSLDKSVKSEISVASQLKDQATDTEMSGALDKLFALRDRVMNDGPASPSEIEPGLILALEI